MLRHLPLSLGLALTLAAGCGPAPVGPGAFNPDDPASMDPGPSDDGGILFGQGPDGDRRRRVDMAMPHGGGQPDLEMGNQPGSPDLAMMPMQGGNGVGPHGGKVDLLHFGLTGDTRPPACEATQSYPVGIITAIADAIRGKGAQFGLDLGDHMYVCNSDPNVAQTQMGYYMKAVARLGAPWFMTMGNHECWHGPCFLNSQEVNYVTYMQALAPISNRPYYSVDIQTSLGLATFVFIADNGWDNVQAAWLDQTLATADKNAKYTIVARHHPEGDNTVVTNADSMAIVRAHKFALLLTGHAHRYQHQTVDNGRDVIIGMGGAPLIAQGTFYGYAMVDQQQNGQLQISVYDVNNNTLQDSWKVNPN